MSNIIQFMNKLRGIFFSINKTDIIYFKLKIKKNINEIISFN